MRETPATEKHRRIYYQSIVYAVCNSLDAIDGKQPGHGIVCGTLEEPTSQVEDRMRKLVEELKRNK